MNKYYYILLLICFFVNTILSAQTLYRCDFEDEQERQEWVLNANVPVAPRYHPENMWYIDVTGNYSPEITHKYGLYVASRETPDTLTYTCNNTMLTVAYRTLTLPAGDYQMRFDWIGKMKNNKEEGVYIYWVPDTVEVASMTSADMFDWMKKDTYRVGDSDDLPLYNAGYWQRGKLMFSVKDSVETRRLMFVFHSTKGQSTSPSFAIDNIEILIAPTCPEPINLSTTINDDGTLTVVWRSYAAVSKYEVRLCDLQTGRWKTQTVVPTGIQTRTTFSGLDEGAQQIQVRSVCEGIGDDGDDVASDWVSKTFLYYLPNVRCVDYMKLDNTTCSWSSNFPQEYVNEVTYEVTMPKQLSNRGAVDNGNDNYTTTMHTLHYMPNEYDPYTLNKLRTKPEGALASVRIGRFEPTHMSRVTYKYKVPEDEDAILVLRYALVLPNPHPSNPEYNPVFVMETLVDGKPIEGECGSANFTSGWGDAMNWNYIPGSENPLTSEDIYWKDWTTVSLNLSEHRGKTVTVTFTTTGCTLSAHGGYGYLTLTCESGEMSGLNCGEENPTTEFTAPGGFLYRWWQGDRDNVISRNRNFKIDAMDTTTYYVDLISYTNELCYHTLEVTGIPRLPHLEAEMREYKNIDCHNVLTFYQNAYIKYKAYRWDIDVNGDSIIVVDREFTKGERLTNIVWDWGDGSPREMLSDSIVTHTYPKSGGHFTARMFATLDGANGDCTDSIDVELDIPKIGVDDEVLHKPIGYQFVYHDGTRGFTYWEEQADTIYEYYGSCEKITYLYIHEINFSVDTAICEGGYFMLGNERITTSGIYTGNLKSVVWPELDSIVTLTLHVEPMLTIELNDTIVHCADEQIISIPYTIIQGTMDTIIVTFDSTAQSAGFLPEYGFSAGDKIFIPLPETALPNRYNAILHLGTEKCPVPDMPICVQNNYPSSVVLMREGVLIVKSAEYTDSTYVFTSDGYQWYRNGVAIPGANQSYLPVGEDPNDRGASFTATVTRAADGIVLPFCEVVYSDVTTATDNQSTGIMVYPTFAFAGQTIYVESAESWHVCNILGMNVLSSDGGNRFAAPAQSGVYFIIFDNSQKTIRFIVH